MLADIFGIPAELAGVGCFILAAGVVAWPVVNRVRSRTVGGKTLRELAFGKPEVRINGVLVRPAEPGWNTIVPQLQVDVRTVLDNTAQLLHENRPNGGNTDAPGDAIKRVEDGLQHLTSLVTDKLGDSGAVP